MNKLYELSSNQKVRIADNKVRVPPEGIPLKKGDIITFIKVDGMYAMCLNDKDQFVHPAAWTLVEAI